MKKAMTVPQKYWRAGSTGSTPTASSAGPRRDRVQGPMLGETNAELLVYCADVADE